MRLNKSKIRLLCFDVDGTLRDTDDQMVQTLALKIAPFRALLASKTPTEIARKIVMALEDPGNFLFGLPDRLGIDGFLARIGNFYQRTLAPKRKHEHLLVPGVQGMLAQLAGHYKMAIVSARDERSTVDFLQHFGLTEYFRVIATSQTCQRTKPFPDPILWAAKELKVHPSECLMIGDTTVDIRAGNAAGCQTVGVLCGFGEEKELREAGATLILNTTSEITNILLP